MEAAMNSREVKLNPSKAKVREFITSDLPLSAFLQTRGHKLLRVQRDGRRLTFIFADSLELGADKLAFINDEVVSMKPRSYASEMRALKTMIFNFSEEN